MLGAGIMGGGIAYQSAWKGVPVVMKDINDKFVNPRHDRSRETAEQSSERQDRWSETGWRDLHNSPNARLRRV
ncbi:hypothetical protein DMI70_00690 [Escherichia coli]|nr:hypothetical protein [Escherichia coli]